MWSKDEIEERKLADLEASERMERFEQNEGATKKQRKKFPSNRIPKKKKRKRK
ncbi:hypothetical protein [Flavobacterium johnsoniae]|uniref:Uncharacterized protein n=1 Tax=Flavobacterium johnsoniae TaxID=986 RepID=A0A1M5IID4_FLAJO|nr:hypothetical protein [Flavobacterium johnsoniae]SHG28062.1 hypothetical protein SAMN05444388_102116 [Flavobacterium johnsoniae]